MDATREDAGVKHTGLLIVDSPTDPNDETWIKPEDVEKVDHVRERVPRGDALDEQMH